MNCNKAIIKGNLNTLYVVCHAFASHRYHMKMKYLQLFVSLFWFMGVHKHVHKIHKRGCCFGYFLLIIYCDIQYYPKGDSKNTY